MDDWTSVVERLVTDNAQWFDSTMRRPLLFTPFLVQYRLWGLNLPAYYVTLGLFYALFALLIYRLGNLFKATARSGLALIAALLFLVYPSNYTAMWLIMFGIYVALALTFLYAIFLAQFGRDGRWSWLVLSLICLLVPLGIYEGQLGIAALWSLLVFVLSRRLPFIKRSAIFLPLVCLIGFALWRTFGFQAAGVNDPYLSQLVTSPVELIRRLLLGYRVTLLWSWTYPLEWSLSFVNSTTIALALIAGGVATALVGTRLFLGRRRGGGGGWIFAERGRYFREDVSVIIIGLALIAAGYVPTLTVFLPSLSGIGSRFNLFASLGGALLLAAVLRLLATALAGGSNHIKILLATAALPLLLLGMLTRTLVQYHNQVAWAEQTQIWQQLREQVPNLADNTTVLFVLTGFEERSGYMNMQRTPLSASWEASSALRLLYGNPTVQGDVAFPEFDEPIEPRLTAEGIETVASSHFSTYDEVIAFEFNQRSQTLTPLETLPAELFPAESGAPATIPLCRSCIQTGSPPTTPYLDLIQQP